MGHLITLLSSIILIVLAACPPASAEDVFIPASSYTAVNNIADRPITIDSSDWLHGLDCEGEWIEYHFDLLGFGVYSSGITVKGTLGYDFHLRMEITGDVSHSIQFIDFYFTGSGFVG